MLLACLGTNAGWATDAAKGAARPQFPFAWQDSKYQDCGQECLYSKGTEQLSFQALYVVRHYQEVKATFATAPNDDEKKRALGTFCGSAESADACLSRFKQSTILQLQRLQQAIGRTDAARRQLESADPAAPVAGRALRPGEAPPQKLPQSPQVLKYAELEKLYRQRENAQLAASVTPAYQEMLAELVVSRKPQKGDFVVFEKERVPGSDRVRTVVKKKPNGDPVYDEKAFTVAMKAWEALHASAADPELRKELLSQDERRRKGGPPIFGDPSLLTSHEIEAYKQAREDMITAGRNRPRPTPSAGAPGGRKTASASGRDGAATSGLLVQPNPNPGALPNLILQSQAVGRDGADVRAGKPAAGPAPRGYGRDRAETQEFPVAKPGVDRDSYYLIYRPDDLQKQIDDLVNTP